MAMGTSAAPITFDYGGGIPPPFGAYAWGGIFVSSSSVVFDHVTVTRGGYPGTSETRRANIVAIVPLVLTNSQITSSQGWGLLRTSTDPTDYATTNTYSQNVSGDIGTLP